MSADSIKTTQTRSNIFGTSLCYMASSVSGQDESNPLPGTTHHVPQEKFCQKPHNKSFIDHTCSVKMDGYWPRSVFFFCEVIDLNSVSVHKHAKMNLANIQLS